MQCFQTSPKRRSGFLLAFNLLLRFCNEEAGGSLEKLKEEHSHTLNVQWRPVDRRERLGRRSRYLLTRLHPSAPRLFQAGQQVYGSALAFTSPTFSDHLPVPGVDAAPRDGEEFAVMRRGVDVKHRPPLIAHIFGNHVDSPSSPRDAQPQFLNAKRLEKFLAYYDTGIAAL